MGRPTAGFTEMLDDDDGVLGPAMRKLNVSQRRFVIAALTFPTGKDWQIAKAAGYSDRSFGALRVAAHRLFHDEKIIAAMHEEAGKRLRSSAILGVSVLAKIARTEGHRDQLKAAEALLNRVGFHQTSEHKVTVDHTDKTGDAMIERIKQLALALGVDPGKLLGVNTAIPMKVIDHDGTAGRKAVGVPSDLDDGVSRSQPRPDQRKAEDLREDPAGQG